MSTVAASSSAVESSGGDGEALTTSAIIAESVTGSHVLHIKGYSLTKGLGNGKFIKSSTFSVGGHCWCIRYYPDGDGVESTDWISFFLQLDRTDADAGVDVKAQLKFSVLDDIGESVPMFTSNNSSTATFDNKSTARGFAKLFERKVLEESSCLKDDCLRVRCYVTVSKGIRTEATAAAKQFVTVPPPDMNRQFRHLLSGPVGADVNFEVAGGVFVAAHRCVLATRSPVFMAELFGPMKEKAMDSIQIQDMDARVFKAMLHFIYTDTMPDIEKRDALVLTQHLLVAADRYGLERLKLICEEKLCNCINKTTVATTLALAEQHGCHGLYNKCIEFLKSADNLKMDVSTESFEFCHLRSNLPFMFKKLLAKVANVFKQNKGVS